MNDLQQLARIALRYLAMFLMAKGYLSEDAGATLMDPATLTILSGVIVSLGTEAWYVVMRKRADK